MNIKELDAKLKDKGTYDNLIEDYQSCFNDIDDINKLLATDKITTEQELNKTQTKLTGLYGSILLLKFNNSKLSFFVKSFPWGYWPRLGEKGIIIPHIFLRIPNKSLRKLNIPSILSHIIAFQF